MLEPRRSNGTERNVKNRNILAQKWEPLVVILFVNPSPFQKKRKAIIYHDSKKHPQMRNYKPEGPGLILSLSYLSLYNTATLLNISRI